MPTSTTPPVTTAELKALVQNGANLKADVPVIQKIVKADKSAIVAAVVHVAILLVTALGLHLNGKDVAILGSIVAVGLSYFVSVNLAK
jgi:hypothetical protein